MRLVVAALCLLTAGAAVITGACGLMARGYLRGQADQQLRAYAAQLVSHPFKASPLYGVAGVPGPGGLGIEVREPAGQVVLRAGPAGRVGPFIPAVPAAVTARGDQPATLAGGGGSWRVITEPIHYRARRIPFSYSAEGFYLVITGTTRRGLPGTLVIGLDLQGGGQAIGRLALTVLAISGAVILAVACLAVALSRALLRPVTQAERTLTAAGAGQLSCRVPQRHGGDAGRLAVALNTMLGQIERAFRTRAESEQAARRARGQLRRDIADVGDQLRKPLSIVRGIAEAYRRGGPVSAGEVDRMMRRVADETARMAALADTLPQSGGLGRRGWLRTVRGGRYLLAAERREQAGQEQRAADTGQPAGDHRGDRAEGGGHRARLRVADPRPAGDDRHLHAHQPSAQLVGHVELEDRAAEHGRDDVGPARHGQQHERGRQPAHEAEAGDRRAPHHHGDDDRAPLSPDPVDPSCGDRADEGTGPGRGVEEP